MSQIMHTIANDEAPWDLYLRAVQAEAGEQVTDGQVLDMLYSLYLKDVPATDAADALPGLRRAGQALEVVLREVEEMHTMRSREDAYARLRARAGQSTMQAAPRAGLLRGRQGLSWHDAIMWAAAAASLLCMALAAWQLLRGDR